MPYYEIGDLIKHLREQQGLTQGMLALKTGVAKSNISRIEKGEQLPKKWMQDSILESLGFNSQLVNYYFTKKEFEMYDKFDKLKVLLFQKKFDEVEALLDELSLLDDFKKDVGMSQYIFLANASIMNNRSNDKDKVRELIYKGLSFTINNFDEKKISTYILNQTDIQLINMLAKTYGEEGNLERAIEIYYLLKDGLEATKVNENERLRLLPLIIFNLTTCLCRLGKHDEVIKMCDYGRDICIKTNNIILLPKIIFNKAYALNEIGDKQLCKRLLYQAYCCCDMLGHYKERDQIKEYAYEKLGIDIVAE